MIITLPELKFILRDGRWKQVTRACADELLKEEKYEVQKKIPFRREWTPLTPDYIHKPHCCYRARSRVKELII